MGTNRENQAIINMLVRISSIILALVVMLGALGPGKIIWTCESGPCGIDSCCCESDSNATDAKCELPGNNAGLCATLCACSPEIVAPTARKNFVEAPSVADEVLIAGLEFAYIDLRPTGARSSAHRYAAQCLDESHVSLWPVRGPPMNL